MNTFSDLYIFIDLAKNNRKYPESTANNLKSSLKIFENSLNKDELGSIDLIEQTIEEIFLSVINDNKDKSIVSLNTYKARLIRVIKDYKRYGKNPGKIQNWDIKQKKSTALLNNKDKKDKNKDKDGTDLSFDTHNHVHKIDYSLEHGGLATILMPRNITARDIEKIKKIIDSFV